jgi:RHS repeat-associated protein
MTMTIQNTRNIVRHAFNELARYAGMLLLVACGCAQAQTVVYYHTDALGTPVAVTDASRNIIERSEYEPYGQLLNRPLTNGPGFTGHVTDAATGLSYMQQRYYDPMLGRFLSNDPVAAKSDGSNFNRYWYADNNPYKYTDPTGEDTEVALKYFFVNYGLIGVGHQYVHIRDTETGTEVISGAHPSSKYPISGALFDRTAQARGSDENIKLRAETSDAKLNSDRPELNPGTKTVPDSPIVLKKDFAEVRSQLESFGQAVNDARIDYRPKSTNSNAYAGTAYQAITGETAPVNEELKGSGTDLGPLIPECKSPKGSC